MLRSGRNRSSAETRAGSAAATPPSACDILGFFFVPSPKQRPRARYCRAIYPTRERRRRKFAAADVMTARSAPCALLDIVRRYQHGATFRSSASVAPIRAPCECRGRVRPLTVLTCYGRWTGWTGRMAGPPWFGRLVVRRIRFGAPKGSIFLEMSRIRQLEE